MKIFKNNTSVSIVIWYFVLSCLYIVFSDKLLLYLFRGDTNNTFLHDIQSFKGIGFVLIIAIALLTALNRRDNKINRQIQNLSELHKKHANLFGNMSHGILYVNLEGEILDINQACLDILGVTKDQMMGKSIYSPHWKPVHEDFSPLQSDEHPTKQAVKSKKPVRNRVIGVFNQKDNDYRWLRVNSIPEFMNGETEPYSVFITIDDISLLKKSKEYLTETNKSLEKALKKVGLSEFLLNEASKMAKIGAYEYYVENDHLFFTDQVYNIFELPKGDSLNVDQVRKILSRASNNTLKIAAEKTMKDGTPFDVELQLNTKGDKKVWVRVMAQAIFDKNKLIIGRRGVIQDISALKEFELELKISLNVSQQNEFLFRQASNLSRLGAYENYADLGKMIWSDQMFEILGLKKGRIPEPEEMYECYTEDSLVKLKEATLAMEAKGTPYDLEFELNNFKDEQIWIRAIAEPLFDDDKKIIGRRGVIQDISESKKVQIELELSKKNIEATLERVEKSEYSLREAGYLAKIGSWEHDAFSNKVWWSDVIYGIYGISVEDEVPDLETIVNIFDEDSKNQLIEAIKECINQGKPHDLELSLTNLKGEKVWVRNMGKPIYNSRNEFIGRRGMLQDITDQKNRTTQIEKAEELYRMLADHTHDLICLHNLDTSFSYLTPSVIELLGVSQEELLGKKAGDLIHEEDFPILEDALENKILKGKMVEALTYRIRHKSGEYLWFESLAGPVFKEGKIVSFVTSSRNITQWMKANKEIEEYQESLQKLTTEILLIEENQKKEIAANIHDHLSQSLVISKMKITEMQKRPELDHLEDELNFVKTHISDAIDNSRKITYELSPPVLYQLGLIDTLYWFAGELEESYGMEVDFHSNVANLTLTDAQSILVFRCIQEVVTNTVKYAKASKIILEVNKNEKALIIDIYDNGIGFDTSTLSKRSKSSSGFGLFAVRERIQNLKGKFSVESEIDKGTSVNFFIPLK